MTTMYIYSSSPYLGAKMSTLLSPHKIIDFASFDEKLLAKSMILLYSGGFTVILRRVARYIYRRYEQELKYVKPLYFTFYVKEF
jgi:hypothetical protein